MNKLYVSFLFLCIAFTGCMLGGGSKIDTAYVQSIRTCSTTEKDLIKHLGEPNHEADAGTYKDLVWDRVEGGFINPFNPKTKSKVLTVRVNPKGKVTSINGSPYKKC